MECNVLAFAFVTDGGSVGRLGVGAAGRHVLGGGE